MRALVTGAGGFCGQHLLPYLEKQGVEVHTLGTKSVGDRHYFLQDPADATALIDIVKAVRPDYVFHLAGVASSKNPTLFYQINSVYAATLLHALEIAGYANCPVLLVGTSAEYGVISPEQLPIREEMKPYPYSHYGISKLSQTLMGESLAKQGRPLVMVRPFNIIGQGMPEYLALQSFAQQIRRIAGGQQAPLIQVGNLSSLRDFVAVQEVVKIYWQLMQLPSAIGQVINICSGQGISIAEILQRLVQLSQLKVDIQIDPERFKAVDIPVHYGSTEKLQQLIGYAPDLNLDSVIKSMLSGIPTN
jgi:GDP-4-dehydro-6-deoxy-D-mannose reductase